MADYAEERAVKLLQGYVWYPRDKTIELADYLPRELKPNIHLLWDEIAPPFTFFDDGTLAASQHFFQLTAMTVLENPDEDPAGIVPWLAEVLQQKLETTPAGVGWQIFEDLRDVYPRG